MNPCAGSLWGDPRIGSAGPTDDSAAVKLGTWLYWAIHSNVYFPPFHLLPQNKPQKEFWCCWGRSKCTQLVLLSGNCEFATLCDSRADIRSWMCLSHALSKPTQNTIHSSSPLLSSEHPNYIHITGMLYWHTFCASIKTNLCWKNQGG